MRLVHNPGVQLNILLVGIGLTTLYFNLKFYDPFNAPKFTIIILVGSLALYLGISNIKKTKSVLLSSFVIFSVFLVLTQFISILVTDTPIWRGLVGTYQRNLGLLTYASFALISISLALLVDKTKFRKVILMFISLGVIESFYGIIQHTGKDFVNWVNPYSPIIGTFGNPNYMSAFLGLFAGMVLVFVIYDRKITLGIRISIVTAGVSAIYLCIQSNSVQGIFAFLTSVLTFSILEIWKKYGVKASGYFSIFVTFASVPVFLGIFNRGPLREIIYQTSISARGDYWRAAIRGIEREPLFGYGIDNFQEVFFENRDLVQVQERGFGTFANNAHNVFLQMGSTSGVLSAICLLVLFLTGILAALTRIKAETGIESFELRLLLSCFVGFLPISMISIDNLGLTVLQWTILGALVSEKLTQNAERVLRQKSSNFNLGQLFKVPILMLSIFCLLITLQIFQIENGLKSLALAQRNTELSEEEFKDRDSKMPSIYKLESEYSAILANLALSKKWYRLSIEYSNRAIESNPNSLNGWRMKAFALESLGETEEAILTRRTLSNIDRYRLDNLLQLTRNYIELGELGRAASIVSRMRGIDLNSEFTKNAVIEVEARRENINS